MIALRNKKVDLPNLIGCLPAYKKAKSVTVKGFNSGSAVGRKAINKSLESVFCEGTVLRNLSWSSVKIVSVCDILDKPS